MPRKRSHNWYLPPWVHKHLKKLARRKDQRKRDGDACWHCGHPMRFGPPFNVGKAATIEHVFPVSRGGTSALDNLKLCHVGCNRHLGANLPEHKMRMRINRSGRA